MKRDKTLWEKLGEMAYPGNSEFDDSVEAVTLDSLPAEKDGYHLLSKGELRGLDRDGFQRPMSDHVAVRYHPDDRRYGIVFNYMTGEELK